MQCHLLLLFTHTSALNTTVCGSEEQQAAREKAADHTCISLSYAGGAADVPDTITVQRQEETAEKGKESGKGAGPGRSDFAEALELQDAALQRYEQGTSSDHLLILNAYEVRKQIIDSDDKYFVTCHDMP